MNIIVGGRQSGKTTKMLEWMKAAPEDEHRICVASSTQESMRLLRLSRELGYEFESWQFIGPSDMSSNPLSDWSGVRYHDRLLGIKSRFVLGFDNLDILLQSWVPYPVGLVTMTGEE